MKQIIENRRNAEETQLLDLIRREVSPPYILSLTANICNKIKDCKLATVLVITGQNHPKPADAECQQ